MSVTTDEPIFNYSIIKSAIELMDEAQCVNVPCSNCALSINDICVQRTLANHLRVLDDEKGGDSQ